MSATATVRELRPATDLDFEPYASWADLSTATGGASKRWLEDRRAEGMPCYRRGRTPNSPIVFKLSEALAWLERHGYFERDRG